MWSEKVELTVADNSLSCFCILNKRSVHRRQSGVNWTHHHTSKMCVKDSAILVVLAMHLKEMRTEILDSRFVVVYAIAKRSDTDIPIRHSSL